MQKGGSSLDKIKTGKIISDARKKLNMTQKDLSEKLFISDKAVSKWERGLSFPDISVLIPLAETLHISLYDLLEGEIMNEQEVEKTLKDTIIYSNSQIKNKKKKYSIISFLAVIFVVIISLITILIVKNNNEKSGIIDRDSIHSITYYSDYKTTLNETNKEKIEVLLMKLPLKWSERTFKTEDNQIEIDYDTTYDEIVKAYNDKTYVNRAMINNALIIFTTISDTDYIRIRFNDYSFKISKVSLENELSMIISNSLLDENNWKETISKKLADDEFVNKAFNLFEKNKVSENEIEKDLKPDK